MNISHRHISVYSTLSMIYKMYNTEIKTVLLTSAQLARDIRHKVTQTLLDNIQKQYFKTYKNKNTSVLYVQKVSTRLF